MIFRVLIFVFLIRTNGKKWYFVEDDFDTVMVVFSKAQLWKLLDRSYIQSSFSTITRHVDNSILKGTLPTLKIWRTWIKIRSHSFIKTWVNMMKRVSTKFHGKSSATQKRKPVLRRTLHRKRWQFTYFYKLLFNSNNPSFQI